MFQSRLGQIKRKKYTNEINCNLSMQNFKNEAAFIKPYTFEDGNKMNNNLHKIQFIATIYLCNSVMHDRDAKPVTCRDTKGETRGWIS